MSQSTYDVLIIGAGLAGLAAACKLQANGLSCLILEADSRIGGRIKTDVVDGFLLDQGFQIFLSAYPEAKALFDYPALKLQPFFNGALVRLDDEFQKVADPWRHPIEGIKSVYNSVGSLKDKLKVGELRQKVLAQAEDTYLSEPETATLTFLKNFGFSSNMIEVFYRPFLGGIFLEPDLATSSRFFEFVFRMFCLGEASLPADGMQAIPQQLEKRLVPNSVRLHSRVSQLKPGSVTLETGETLESKAILLATDATHAQELLGLPQKPEVNGVSCLYYEAPEPPITEPILILNGGRQGYINNVVFPSVVAPTYAPAGKTLVSVSVLNALLESNTEDALYAIQPVIEKELIQWFGPAAANWKWIRSYYLPHALPSFSVPQHNVQLRTEKLADTLFRCGDYLVTPSLNGALASGRRAAEHILASVFHHPKNVSPTIR